MALTKVTGQVIKNTTDVTVGVLTVTNTLAVGGTVSIGGTLTYEDVTNVDAVGLITARNGIVVGSGITLSKDGDIFATGITTVSGNVKVGTGITLSPDGDGFFTGVITATSYSGIDLSDVTGATGDFSIADKIVHTGDTNTALRFPAADTVTVETGGSERLRINSSGQLGLGASNNSDYDASAQNLLIASSGTTGITLRSGGSSYYGAIHFADGTSSSAEYRAGRILYEHSSDSLLFYNANTFAVKIDGSGNMGIGENSPSNLLHVKVSDTGINPHTSAQIVLERSGTNYLQFLTATDGTSGLLFGDADDMDVAQIKYDHNVPAMQFVTETGERMRIDNAGRILIGTTTAVGSNTPNLQVKAASPASGFDNHIYLEGSETNGNANTGATIGFGGHDGTTARNWAQIAGFKTNGSSGNTSSFLSFRTRRSGVSGINEMWKITAMGSLLSRDNKESAIGREWTNGNVPAGQTRDHTDNSKLNFNSIGGNGGGHITCLSISSQDQNPSGAMIIAGVHGQGFNSYDTILSNFDSGISVTFSGGTISIQNTSSEIVYYSVNVIHMGTGNTTYLGR